MNITNKAPNIPVKKFKRAKIIATLGPSTYDYDSVLQLIKSGANGIRLNFSHGTHEEHEQQIKRVRKAAKEYGKPVAVIQDLQGPKVRLGDFDGIINVQKGQTLTLKHGANYEQDGIIPLQFDLSKKAKRGERLHLFDGRITTKITSVKDKVLHVTAENDGILVKRKGINLPDTDFEGDVITKKDLTDLAWGSKHDVDYVAQSFVQTAADVHTMKRHIKNLGMHAKVIAKFETKSAVENMDEIIQTADGIMIARGDLAVELSAEKVPIIQRQLVEKGIINAKPVIVATQMLYSMVDRPQPSRAEVSDVASAVFMGADAVMLSDETASGRYPTESVEEMKKIILSAQDRTELKTIKHYPEARTKQSAICDAIVELAGRVKASAIVAETRSGATALQIAARRPELPIIAVTSDPAVARQLALVYGTKGYVRPDEKLQATKLTNWLRQHKILHKGDMTITASGQHPGVVGTTDTIKVRLLD